MKKAIVTGITGQDGSYLTEILLSHGYEVHGIIRKSSSFNTGRIDHLYNDKKIMDRKLFLHYGDVVDTSSLNRLLDKIEPDEIYNLAAQSHVKASFDIPDYTAQVDALGTLRFIDAMKETGLKRTRFYQASTSELFGKVSEVPQTEKTPFYPRSPYGAAKLYAYWIIVNYREAYNIFASNGILFNHESPRRGETFVTRKITRAAARIILGKEESLSLGNLNAKRDWGYAPEYCEAMRLILQHDKPDDFVIATGETHSVREFAERTFAVLGVDIEWTIHNSKEVGIAGHVEFERNPLVYRNRDKLCSIKKGKHLINVSENYYRPTEVEHLIGNPGKAEKILGWKAETKFEELIKIMAKADFEKVLARGY